MSKLFRVATLISILLLIVAIPFIAIGGWFEPAVERWIAANAFNLSPWQSASAIIGLLAVDIALPIPSSGVCTFAGRELGWFAGGIANWIGLNLSSLVGYWIGRHPGRWFANGRGQLGEQRGHKGEVVKTFHEFQKDETLDQFRDADRDRSQHTSGFADASTIDRLENWSERSSTMCLLICRPLPLLAEASVILMGIRAMPHRQFWPPILISNFVLGIGYAVFGHFASVNDTFWPAFLVSLLLPLIFVVFWRATSKPDRPSPREL